MELDPILLEVIRNRLDVIANEMQITLLRSAFSSIVKEGADASSALFDPAGQTIAQAIAIPMHLGMLVPAVRRILELYPPETMAEGDVYLMNDPYDGGTHLPDIAIVVPIHHGGRCVALGCSMAHHQEMGGKSPGSIPIDATELYQEGLVIPPDKLYDRGRPNATLINILRRNLRIPDIVMGDIRAQIAAGSVGRRRFQELLDELGAETVFAYIAALFDRAEALTRQRLRTIPAGTWRFTDYMDNDGIDLDRPVRIRATITIRDGEFFVDFAGTSPQVKGPFNSVPSATNAAVYYTVKAVAGADIPNNAGCFRPVHITIPPGSLLNANHPAPLNARNATMKRVVDVLFGALAQAVPKRIPAASSGQLLVMSMGGIDPRSGRAYVTSELGAGGMGARPGKDGVDFLDTDVSNCANIPAEAIELDFPIRILACNLRDDSGGPGQFRGGVGLRKAFEVTRGECVFSYRGERHFLPPWGLLGGRPARPCLARIRRRDGREEEIPSKRLFTLTAGERLEVCLPGGGGYGDPLERPPELVREDVLDRKVSAETARAEYGVLLDAETGALDLEATQRLRDERRRARGPITWTFDRGYARGGDDAPLPPVPGWVRGLGAGG